MAANNYNEALKVLLELKVSNPSLSLGQHISTALSEYGDVWGMSDKEILFAFRKYKAEMEFNEGVPDKSIEKIIEEGTHLDTILDEEEEEDDL